MAIIKTDIPSCDCRAVEFANHLIEKDCLSKKPDTDVKIEVNAVFKEDRNAYVRVKEYGNDGLKMKPIQNEQGEIVKYVSEGTSVVGEIVQEEADEFFGRRNYMCGFYEDEMTSRTIITPT